MALLTLKFVTDVRDNHYEVIEFHGELDQSTLLDTEKQMNDFLEKFDRPRLIFDLANLRYTNSDGIAFMVAIHAKLAKRGSKLLLARVQPNVADIMGVIGLGKLIPTFKTIEEAIAFVKKSF